MNSNIKKKYKLLILEKWFRQNGWEPFRFQLDVWESLLSGRSGLLNAPTGSGKTYALWIPVLLKLLEQQSFKLDKRPSGLQVIWITPLRALATDLQKALMNPIQYLDLPWQVEIRTGDTPSVERKKQIQKAPVCIITTPESLHILFSQSKESQFFKTTQAVIVDEWHELMGTKRGTQTELAISRIKKISQNPMTVWGISATIGNLEEAANVLLQPLGNPTPMIIKARLKKRIAIKTIMPKKISRFPWAGHLGLHLASMIIPIIDQSTTTLLFTNTRSQTELWYREILRLKPEYAGIMAMHHGSIDHEIRKWVEAALSDGKLKLVICTSSLDLGVDFSPVETIIQVGGPKGISRFMQRAGRSGHQPGGLSKIYFVPTNSLELVEAAALKMAAKNNIHESRKPIEKPLDVLIQYLVTRSVGAGFLEEETFEEVKSTFAFQNLSHKEWTWALNFITSGGKSLANYTEFTKVIKNNNHYTTTDKKISARHRLSIGTIVGDPMLQVRLNTGGYLGSIEESFVSSLNPGDVFWFGGRPLEYIKIHELTVFVNKSSKKGGRIPVWGGGRLPLSSQLSSLIRQQLEMAQQGIYNSPEMKKLKPLLDIQQKWSVIPDAMTLLIEDCLSKDGHHVYIYPFEGRFIHEILSALIALRISRIKPISLSIAMNDYGFELLSDQQIPLEEALKQDLFTTVGLTDDIDTCINNSGLSKQKFRDIATISGLIFRGFPGRYVPNKHLNSSSGLLYEVFKKYEPTNLLIKQAKEEVITLQLDYARLLQTLHLINKQKIKLIHTPRFTPFAFPIMTDRLRQNLTSESTSDKILQLQKQFEGYAN